MTRRILLPLLVAMMLAPRLAAAGSRPRQYKRVHQRIMKLVEKDKNQDAVAKCEDFLKKHPKDAETLFCLAVAQAWEGKTEDAAATAKRAIEAGLPAGRFFAGPREAVKALLDISEVQDLLKEHPDAALVHGPMLGCVTDTGARFWVRTARPAEVQMVCTPADGAEEHRSQKARTVPDSDFTATVVVNGLQPDKEYEYSVVLDGEAMSRDARLKFRTFPRAGQPAKFRVAFGGGAGYVAWNERVWDTIRKQDPHALLLLGDNVYIDDPKSPFIQRYTYYRRQSRPEFRRLVARTPVYAVWDDHDFGTNDCVPGPHVDRPAWKVPAWRVFTQNWNNPAYGGGPQQPGCWFAFSIADVDFFLTDSRFYRTNPKGKNPTLLGPAQKAWLLDQLKASTATFKVLINGVPWSTGTKGGSLDTWDGFPEEREEIFSFIEENCIEGVFLLAADRHRSDVWKTERPDGYPLYEFESSRLTNQHRHGSINKPQCLFSYNKTQSFGLLDFDTAADDPTVTYRIVTIDGEEVHAFPLKKSQLTK
jgi:alkaline phosphatase D